MNYVVINHYNYFPSSFARYISPFHYKCNLAVIFFLPSASALATAITSKHFQHHTLEPMYYLLMLPNLRQFVFLSQGVIHFLTDVGRRVRGIDVGDGAGVAATEVDGVAVGG